MAKNTILSELTFTSALNNVYGYFYAIDGVSTDSLVVGETYRIAWDGAEYSCQAMYDDRIIGDAVFVGDASDFGYPPSEAPFIIAVSGTEMLFLCLDDTSATNHTVAIYQVIAEEVGIVIKNYSGIPIEYKGVEKVMFNTADGGKRVYSKGEALEDVSIELDFSSGDQTVKAAEGTLIKSAVIKKPDTLVAENIVKDVEIAGVVGTGEGGGGIGQGIEYVMNDNGEIEEAIFHGMTYVPAYAFYNNTTLRSVDFSDSPNLSNIGDWAFYKCTALTSITIPNGVTSIGGYAFQGCTNLPTITIPDSVTSVGNRPFQQCTGLTSVTIGNGLTEIISYMFYGCSNLIDVTIGNNVVTIGQSAFQNCSSLTSIVIPDSVTTIIYDAFRSCSGLKSAIIGDGVTEIGASAFRTSGLTTVTIGSSVTKISSYAFASTALTSATFKTTEGWWVSTSVSATSGTTLDESNLANTSTAANYLKTKYPNYYWNRT